MPPLLTTGAMVTCSFGSAPMPFDALEMPGKPVIDGALVSAVMTDIVPELNVPPFVLCNSPTNPEVIAATAAKLGVFTPMPCQPVVVTPWMPASPTVSYMGIPLATETSTCECAYLGLISVAVPAQMCRIANP